MQSRLTVLDSGSHGNGYILESCGEQLIIECGVPFKECNKALNGKIENVQGVIVSHAHSDHLGYVKQYLKHGLSIWSCPEVSCIENRVHDMKPLLKYHIGDFYVCPLSVKHGFTECFSFIIDTPDKQRCIFATDLQDFPYQISGINHALVECNYSEELRLEALMKNTDIRSASGTHMELSTCVRVLNRLKSPDLSSVVLLHLSDSLSDAEGFKQRIYKETGIKTEVAEKNRVFILRNDDF